MAAPSPADGPRARRVVVTGAAGYIGSLLCRDLLDRGARVTALDNLLFGRTPLEACLSRSGFSFVEADICDGGAAAPAFEGGADEVVHLAAIVGYPACARAGSEAAYRTNLEGTRSAFALAEAAGARRFVFASTYSNYGLSPDGRPVTEESPLRPQSVYAESKIAAEELLLGRAAGSPCAPVVLRFATLFGPSPRTRFDLIINQFVREAVTRRRLVVYERGFSRSFVHVRDVVRAITAVLAAPEPAVRGQVFNVGSNAGNYTKEELCGLIRAHVPGLEIVFEDRSFAGDMRDIRVAFDKIERVLGWRAEIGVEDGIRELADGLLSGRLGP